MCDVLITVVGLERFSGLSLVQQFNLVEEKILVLQIVVEAFPSGIKLFSCVENYVTQFYSWCNNFCIFLCSDVWLYIIIYTSL